MATTIPLVLVLWKDTHFGGIKRIYIADDANLTSDAPLSTNFNDTASSIGEIPLGPHRNRHARQWRIRRIGSKENRPFGCRRAPLPRNIPAYQLRAVVQDAVDVIDQHSLQFAKGFEPLPAKLIHPALQVPDHGSLIAVRNDLKHALWEQAAHNRGNVNKPG